jgi:uncharacterized protein YdhG (YjbR/CyaY superfamily)
VEQTHVYRSRHIHHYVGHGKNHLSVLPEEKTMVHFADEIAQAGYSASSCLIQNSMN